MKDPQRHRRSRSRVLLITTESTMTDETNDFDKFLSEVDSKFDARRQKYDSECNRLRQKNKEKDAEIEQLKKSVAAEERKAAKLCRQVEQLQCNFKGENERINSRIEEEAKHWKDLLEECRVKNQQQQKIIDQKLDEKQREILQLRESEARHRDACRASERELEMERARYAEMKDALRRMNDEVSTMKRNEMMLRHEMAAERGEQNKLLESLQSELHRVNELEIFQQKLTSDNTLLKQKLVHLTAQASISNLSIPSPSRLDSPEHRMALIESDEMRRKCVELERSHERLAGENERLRQANAAALAKMKQTEQQQVIDLKSEIRSLSSSHENEADRLNGEIRSVSGKLMASQEETASLTSKNADLRRDVTELKEKLRLAKEEWSRAAIDETEMRELKEEAIRQRNEIQHLREQRKHDDETHRRAQRLFEEQMGDMEIKQNDLQLKNKLLQEQFNNKSIDNKNLQQKIQVLAAELQQRGDEIKSMSADIASTNESSTKSVLELEEANRRLECELDRARKEKSERRASVVDRIEQQARTIAEKEATLVRLSSEVSALRAENASLNVKIQNVIKTKDDEIAEVLRSKNSLMSTLAQLTEQLQTPPPSCSSAAASPCKPSPGKCNHESVLDELIETGARFCPSRSSAALDATLEAMLEKHETDFRLRLNEIATRLPAMR